MAHVEVNGDLESGEEDSGVEQSGEMNGSIEVGGGRTDMQKLRMLLVSPSPKHRLPVLQTIRNHTAAQGLSGEEQLAVLQHLIQTTSHNIDRASRVAIQDCIRLLVTASSHSDENMGVIINYLQHEQQRTTYAYERAGILVAWCVTLLQAIALHPEKWNKWGLKIIEAEAILLEEYLNFSLRNLRKRAVLRTARRGLRAIAKSRSLQKPALVEMISKLAEKGSTGGSRNAVMLGVIAGVCDRIPSAKAILVERSSDFYTFYSRELIGSKVVLPLHISRGLNDFFASSAVSTASLEQEIAPAAEKALLRAPEVVLNDLLPELIASINPQADLSELLKKNLSKPLLSSLKSTNQTIRQGALTTFRATASKCRDERTMTDIAEELMRNLKEAKSADQRTLFALAVASIPPLKSSVTKGLSDLLAVATKETGEAALDAEAQAIGAYVTYSLLQDTAPDVAVVKAFTAGFSDKKPGVRRIWTLQFGKVAWSLDSQSLEQSAATQFFEPTLDSLSKVSDEVHANPVSAAQNGILAIANVVVALGLSKFVGSKYSNTTSKLRKTAIFQNALGLDAKSSYLVNHRVYAKLITEEDQLWFLRALMSAPVHSGDSKSSASSNENFGQAMIFMLAAAQVHPAVRNEAVKVLEDACFRHPKENCGALIAGVWSWLRSLSLEEKESPAVAARTGKERLNLIFKSICPALRRLHQSGDTVLQETLNLQLVRLLVLCRMPLVPRVSWIGICLESGADPKTLVEDHKEECLDEVSARALGRSDAHLLETCVAACDAMAELVFVAPEKMTSQVIELIESDLNPRKVQNISSTDASIFHTPEGVTFVDVLSQRAQPQLPDKKTKDYDTLKWEQELRNQLAEKQKSEKKLTADEQTKVKAQLAKEANIRAAVKEVESKLQRGIGVISSLSRGPPTDTESWIGIAVNFLTELIRSGVEMLVGSAAALAYLECANQASHRLGPMRRFVGVAVLRSLNASRLPAELLEEDLGDLVTRVLYRLRFIGEQRPLDTISVIYILPLIDLVLEKGGIGRKSDEEADEQITLALEFLAFHTDLFSSVALPRQYVSNLLIKSLQRYNQHYKLLKDCLFNICSAISTDATADEVAAFLRGCIVPESSVRTCCLQAVDNELELENGTFAIEIWIACHEDVSENSDIAKTIWEENSLQTTAGSCTKIIKYLEAGDQALRRATARALGACVSQHPEVFSTVLSELSDIYADKAKPRVPQRDAYGMPIKTDLTDPWQARHGIALAINELSPHFQSSQVVPFVTFLVEKGPLGDGDARVRDQMVEAGTNLISLRGDTHVEDLMQIFESTLNAPDSGSRDHDKISEAVIVMYGALARHLTTGDSRIPKVVTRLLETLNTPSETVQYAIANCLPPLIQTSRPEVSQYMEQIMSELLQSKKYANRRGAAYGLAGIVQGCGLGALREFRVLLKLKSALESKKDQNQRQGAFLAYELLSLILGPLFEPYVIQIVPQLLSGFGDSSADVRESCLDAAKTCFATLSSFGVKQVLPTLLEGLDDQQWRSKKGACDSLGAMAYLDPQQLAISLPDIIPPLTSVLNDSHKEVRASANRSLQRFGDVISNPEIKSLVNILLKALSDPTKHTEEALDALLKVSFIHYLDAPSLALVVRILERGLGDRSSTKRKAAQVIGSLAHLTERKDLVPNLPILVSGLRIAAVDPVPGTRATASKALGSLMEKLGEDALPDLIPSLMSTLKTDTGAGDRLGSAQALSEVLAGLGTGRLEESLPSILQNVSSSKAAVREGFMSLFIFLPACFGTSFANYLNRIIPPILSGLADDVESIRETALRAGRLLVKNFASRAIDLLLPELQRGLADDSHRIRLSSVELVGDLLFNLTGISAQAEEGETEDTAPAAGQSLLEVLGEEKRNNILSALYISRCDTSGLVRSAAINVWKALVPTPRTLREITPTLTQLIIRRLASSNMEQKVIAGNALGELIRKAGEGVLASLLPTLEEGLQTTVDTDAKQGICIAMRELIASAAPDTLEDYEPKLVSVVRTALIDPNAEVREAAAEAFDSMQRIFGKKMVDQILPSLLGSLQKEDEAENALAALLTLLTDHTRSNIVLPTLLPTLLASPISSFNAKALASLASVAGPAMTRRLKHIIESLMENIVKTQDEERLEALDNALDAVMLSADEFDGLNTAMSVMFSLVKHEDHRRRAAVNYHLANFFTHTEVDFSRYYADLIRALLICFDDGDAEVIKSAWTALSALTSRLRKEDMESLVLSTRQALNQVGVPGYNLPGFLLPKGINAILPIFLQGLINGTPDQRIQSAMAISEIIDKTNGDSLKPFVTQITGPLIRVVSERSTDVKAAILLTLNQLLEKIPTLLKPFIPQLQRTFTKALADTSSETLRSRAARALGTLITMTPRIDPLIGELVTGSKTSDPDVKAAMQKALYEVISKVGANMSELSRNSITALIDEDSVIADDATAITNARLLGALTKNLTAEVASGLIKARVLTPQFSKSSVLALNAVLLESPITLTQSFPSETVSTICRGIGSSESMISENCVLAAGKLLLTESSNKNYDAIKDIFATLARAIEPGKALDTRRLGLVVLRTVSRENNDLIRPHLASLAPPIFASVRDPVIPIKLSAEAAFLGIFCVVEEDNAVFEKYIAGSGSNLPPNTKRSMQDYFKRVASRLAAQARERREAEGGQGGLGLSNDEREDEREIWSVGKVDLGEVSFEA